MKSIIIFLVVLLTIGIFQNFGIDLVMPLVLFLLLYSIYQLAWKPIAMAIAMKKAELKERKKIKSKL